MGRKMTCREAVIQTLPEKWDDKETRISRWGAATIAVNPKFAPMMYKDGKWEEIKFKEQDVSMDHYEGRLI